jgi:hypothetical protein
MGLVPDYDASFRLLVYWLPRMPYFTAKLSEVQGDAEHAKCNTIDLNVSDYGSSESTPHLFGNRARSILLCQPPIKVLSLTSRCCTRYDSEQPTPSIVLEKQEWPHRR